MRQVLSIPAQLGPLLKAARKNAGLSQQALAQRLGISQSRMSHMELNPGSVNLEQLLSIFAVLGLEVVVGTKASATAYALQAAQPLQTGEKPPAEW